MIESIAITFMTILVYCIANAFSIKIGTSEIYEKTNKPLYDITHEFLPNWSKIVYIRDIAMICLFIPLIIVKPKWSLLKEVYEQFQLVILIKAICIFFTYIPSSNTDCHKKINLQNINHCHHNSTSGHAALCTLLGILYFKCGVPIEIVFICVLLYSLLILLTRAHYTVDVWQGIIVSLLVALP